MTRILRQADAPETTLDDLLRIVHMSGKPLPAPVRRVQLADNLVQHLTIFRTTERSADNGARFPPLAIVVWERLRLLTAPRSAPPNSIAGTGLS